MSSRDHESSLSDLLLIIFWLCTHMNVLEREREIERERERERETERDREREKETERDFTHSKPRIQSP